MGDTGGACGVASAPDGPAGPAAAVCRHRHRDRAPATPGLWPALAANRRAAALVVYPARSGHWHTRPHDLLPAQPRPDARLFVGTGPEDWACSRLIDATGLKVYGAGEWLAEKHGERGQRTWRKLHLAVDPNSGEILASELTTIEEGDAALVGPLLDQITSPIASVTADGAYDGEPVYRAVAERQPDPPAAVVIPPRASAVPSPTADTAPS